MTGLLKKILVNYLVKAVVAKTALYLVRSFVSLLAFQALEYLQAFQSYNSAIQVHKFNYESKRDVHRNLKVTMNCYG